MFQPCTGNFLDLGPVANFYVAMLLSLAPPFPSAVRCPPGRATCSCPLSLSIADRLVPTQDHPPTWESLVSVPAYQDHFIPDSDSSTSSYPPPLPWLPDSHRRALANAKYLLKYPSAVSEPPFAAATAHGASPLPSSHLPIVNLIYRSQ